MSRVICINSTVPARRRMRRDGHISPLHYWDFQPGDRDIALAHRDNRVEITLRARLGGIDLPVAARTAWELSRGAAAVYAVTQPDIWQALPWLRRRFPSRRFVTWAWMDWEVDRHLHRFRACDHVFCLTEGAKRRMGECGLDETSSLAIWGCDPGYYADAEAAESDTDICLVGLTSRDVDLTRRALASGRFTALVTHASYRALGLGEPPASPASVTTLEIETERKLVRMYHRCRVSWIPLVPRDPYPSGYTNLIESLLCGTAAVIGDTTTIPRTVISLPGVFSYRTGDAEDFVRRTEDALAFMRTPGARGLVAQAAARSLDGAELARAVRRELGIEERRPAACAS